MSRRHGYPDAITNADSVRLVHPFTHADTRTAVDANAYSVRVLHADADTNAHSHTLRRMHARADAARADADRAS
jgi:hypothetical protein